MVIKSSDEAKSPASPGVASQADTATPASAYGYDFHFAPLRGMHGRGMRGIGMHMGRHGPHYAHRPEVVSLEGEAGSSDPAFNHPGHHAFWVPPTAPDPPLAPTPPVAPNAPHPPQQPPFGFGGQQPDFAGGLASWIGDFASRFGAPPPPPGAPETPHRGPFGHLGGGPMSWRMRGRGGWRGGWGRPPMPPTPSYGHRHHHPPGPPGHFPHREHGPIRPKMNIQHTGNVFTVTLELPGLQKEDVDISVADGVLTVSGEFIGSAPSADSFPPGYEAEFEMMDDACDTLYGGEEEIEEGVAAMNLGESHVPSGDCDFVLRERRFGPFKRSVRLPSWVDVDTIKATMAHGVLTLMVEKPQEPEMSAPPKKITVL